jgi:hypothetical protein
MKRNLKSTITHLRRRFKVFAGQFGNARTTQRMKRPSMSQSEEQATRIWTKVVHQVDSDLMYNPQTHEAYAQWESPGGTIYLFLEAGNLRVINTVVGYDIRLSDKVEQWCASIFSREVAKRRNKFRKGAESKVIHSLDSLESRLESL